MEKVFRKRGTHCVIYQATDSNKLALSGTLVVDGQCSEIDFTYNGVSVDRWTGLTLAVKGKTLGLCNVYQLPTFDGLLSKFTITAKSTTPVSMELRLQLIANNIAAAIANTISCVRHHCFEFNVDRESPCTNFPLTTWGDRDGTVSEIYVNVGSWRLQKTSKVQILQNSDTDATILLDRSVMDQQDDPSPRYIMHFDLIARPNPEGLELVFNGPVTGRVEVVVPVTCTINLAELA